MKTCSKCGVPKDESEFHRRAASLDGLRSNCKSCTSEEHKERYIKNPLYYKASSRKFYLRNREALLQEQKEWYAENREEVLRRDANNRPAINLRKKIRYHSDHLYKLTVLLRGRVLDALAGKSKKSAKTVELLGAPWVWVEAYLEEQFQPGMSWENHGPIWEIDHIRPVASFDLTDLEQQRMCFHWTNLQPLFTPDNRRKSDTYDPLNV